jgi:primosomal protein N' (replication factor Y)
VIVTIAIDVPIFQLFDYTWNQEELFQAPQIGDIVKVEFGKKITAGIVLQIDENKSCANDQIRSLKSVLAIAPDLKVTKQIISLCQFSAKYYLKPLGETLFTSIPTDWKKPNKWALLQKQKLKEHEKKQNKSKSDEAEYQWDLNEEQIKSLEYLQTSSKKNKFEITLLKGITGSGKTAVYLTWLKEVLKDESAQCLILVPEINLTPQLEKIVKQVFVYEEVTVLHSDITPVQRNIAWWKIEKGISRVILGTRLSTFAPAKNIKAIVIDEEHDNSYKQQDGLRYNARDLAIWRAAELKIPIVLTSATPSSETWHKVLQKKISLLTLNKKAKDGASLSTLNLIDLAVARKNKKINAYGITEELHEVITRTQKNNKQTLIYINRRGYAPILHCKTCSWKSNCNKCSAWMVVHKKIGSNRKVLQCHHCGSNQYMPLSCPECGNQDLETLGMGTQKIEEFLKDTYPQIELIRIDSDSTKSKGSAEELFKKIHAGDPAIIIGTQMIIKGHDFQHIQSIIVIDVDKSLYSQDFRAIEKIFSQLVQVAGRAGRGEAAEGSNIYIQTEFIDHPMFKALAEHQYDQFITDIVKERQDYQLPPYSHQALIIAESKSEQINNEVLNNLKQYLEQELTENIQISDPTPRVLQRLSGVDRNQILIETNDRIKLQKTLEKALDYIEVIKKKSRSIKLLIDRDPLQF